MFDAAIVHAGKGQDRRHAANSRDARKTACRPDGLAGISS